MSFRRGLRLAGFARRHLGRMNAGRSEVMAHLSSPRADNLPMPTFVQLRVTNLCNLRCKMCGQWGETGIFRSHSGSAGATDGALERDRIRELIGLKRQLALSDYVRLLDELAPSRPIISLFGGEPLLYPDIVPLVREVKARGLTCTVITNGGRLEPLARELVESGIDSIAISIDGPPDVHNRIRGQADSFERAAAGVAAVAGWRKRLGRVLPMQIAILPVTELNIDVIAPAIEVLRGLAARYDQRGVALVRPRERGRRVRARHAGGPRRRGDVLEGLRVRRGARSRRRRAGSSASSCAS